MGGTSLTRGIQKTGHPSCPISLLKELFVSGMNEELSLPIYNLSIVEGAQEQEGKNDGTFNLIFWIRQKKTKKEPADPTRR